MAEHIDTALDRLANGADDNTRLTLETILRTGLCYMNETQVRLTQTLCPEALVPHNAVVPAYMAGQRQIHPQHGSNVGTGNGAYHQPAPVQPRPRLPGEERFAA